MTYEEFAKLFDGYTTEQIESAMEFIKLYHKADTDTQEAVGEFLEACEEGVSLTEAINRISNTGTRARWIEHAKAAGIYEKTA